MYRENGFKLRISSEAYNVIIDESKKWNGVETGTVLIGTQDNDGFTVTHALRPGPKARRSWGSFSPDHEHINKELQRLRAEYTVDFLGIHHLHPGDMSYPSGGDLRQAKEILNDPDYKINGRLLSIISIKKGDDVIIFPYVITRDEMIFKKLDYAIVSEKLTEVLRRRADSLSLSTWLSGSIDKERRMAREIQDITRLIGVPPSTRILKGAFMAIEVKDILFLLPTEYPLTPPRVFSKKREKLKEIVIDEQLRWNSTFDIVELMQKKKIKLYLGRKRLIENISFLFKRIWHFLNMPLFKSGEKEEIL